MLTFFGQRQEFCDGVSRRNFLKVGALTLGGLSLGELLREEARAGVGGRRKSIINIYLPGGPSHMDMFDLKPAAPTEYRGEFHPVATNIPGIDICEHFPRLAKMAEKYTIIRSMTGIRDEHSSRQSDTGWSESSMRTVGGRPGIGAVVSKLHGTVNGNAPTAVGLSGFSTHGYLSPVYREFRPDGAGRENLRLGMLTAERLDDRRSLLGSLDRMRRDMDHSGMMNAMDDFTSRAVQVVLTGTMSQALDLKKEDPRVLELYGLGRDDQNRNFLLARRLVEAGVRVVTVSWGGWDTHSQNFVSLKKQLPKLDVALSALIEDLDQRGMLQDTMVMMSGEFGRTPRINGGAGRDHWSPASTFFLAGGGLRHGQVIGTTSAKGEQPVDRPMHIQRVFATVYQNLGLDPRSTTIMDSNGRPQYLVDQREPIEELI